MKGTKILILGLILYLSGCVSVIDQKGLKLAQDYCKDKGGLFSVEAGSELFIRYVTCKNGGKIMVSQLEKQGSTIE